jgi:hypothetical protein
MPEIHDDVLEITSLKELMSLISVPLRGSHTSNISNHEKYPDTDFWCPPCQQSRNEDEYQPNFNSVNMAGGVVTGVTEADVLRDLLARKHGGRVHGSCLCRPNWVEFAIER